MESNELKVQKIVDELKLRLPDYIEIRYLMIDTIDPQFEIIASNYRDSPSRGAGIRRWLSEIDFDNLGYTVEEILSHFSYVISTTEQSVPQLDFKGWKS
jgi:hypothetical protein